MRSTSVTASAVAVLLLLLLVFYLALGSSFAFFLIGSIIATFIFVIVILRQLIQHDIFHKIKFPWRVCALPLLTISLLAVVIMLCIRVKKTSTVFFSCIGADLVLAIGIRLHALRRVRTRTRPSVSDVEEEPQELEFSYLRRVGGLPKKFKYEELHAATNNFQTPIGRGGSGSVFKGVLGDGLLVAVKRIEGEVHGEREFRSEITAIVSAQHVNLVTILGYCLVPGGHRYLVYEFIQNGSLDSWIFPGREENGRCLTWALRYQVAIDVAKALAYLHHDCRSRILHLDVKPQNILLDENFKARVSDFGISRMMNKDESRVVTTIRGTRGYLAPEWFSRQGISEKSDVYSFGMVLLELVGGRKNFEFYDDGNVSQRTWFYFPKVASEMMREGRLMEAVDKRLAAGGEVEEAELRIMVYVAIWCIQERAELRPSMELVVSMLKGHVPVDKPPETKMFMVDLVLPVDSETVSVLSRAQTSTAAAQMDHPPPTANSISISSIQLPR